jgi:hypothetical protein
MSFFASLEACASCGARVEPDGLTFYGADSAWSLTGWCPHCRGPLTFRFLTHGNPIEGICPVGELGTGRSEIIAPSALMNEIERLSPSIELDPTRLPIAAWKLNRDTNRRVLICLAELAKFIPAGAEEIPTEVLGPTDLADRTANPGRYLVRWIDQLLERHRRALAAIGADLPRIDAIDTELTRTGLEGIHHLDRDAQGQPVRADGMVIEGPGADELLATWRGQPARVGARVAGPAGHPAARDDDPDELVRRLADVIARPTDPSPRRAYANAVWHRDPERAELIVCQLALRAARRAHEETPIALSQRATLLTHRRGRAWAEAIAPMVNHFAFYGGFVESVGINADRLAQAAHALPALAPIRHLSLRQLHGRVETLLGLPPSFLRALVSLDLSKNKLDDAEVIAIVTCPHLVNVDVLDLARNPITDACLRAIELPALRYVETAETAAELVEVGGEDWGGAPPSRHFRSLQQRLVAALGRVAWLRDVEPPHLDTL